MIATLLRIGWINIRRDRAVQALTFLLPIIFFSIFATVFGNQRNPTRKVNVAIADEDRSEYSGKLVAALKAEGSLNLWTTSRSDDTGPALDATSAEALVKKGTVPVALVLPKGLGAGHRIFDSPDPAAPKVQLLADVSDPIAPQMVQGLLQKVAFTAAPDIMADEGMAMFEKYAGPLTPAQQQARDSWRKLLQSRASEPADANSSNVNFGLPVEVVNVMQPGNNDAAAVSFYAAGIGVMFLLFSCSGAGGALLDEQEAGTLERLIGSRAGMNGVLAAKWIFLILMGVGQLTLMFTWGMLLFGLPLKTHLPGFFVMTVATAAAAGGFGLVLATIARSRQQLSGMSTILILTMSALGGSMFPRFMMSETMQKIGRVTFNAWALDGYTKVFWREAPISALWPEVSVLAGLTVVFLLIARKFARRWETV